MCLFWTLPVVVHQELLPSTKQGSPGLQNSAAQLFLRQGQSHGMEMDMGREMHKAGLQQLQQHIRFSRALKQMWLVLALTSRAAELGHCWRFWKFFARWAGNSKRNIVVSLRLWQREELSSGLCSLVDVLHLCKSSHCITGLGMTVFCHPSSSSLCMQRWQSPRPRDMKPLCNSAMRAGPPQLTPSWLYGRTIWRDLGNKPIFPPTNNQKNSSWVMCSAPSILTEARSSFGTTFMCL